MMKILVLSTALLLAGCGETLQTINYALTDRPNPVTQTMLHNAEIAFVGATVPLNAYRTACERKQIDRSCRAIVAHLQTYTIKAEKLLPPLRRFVDENDQVNAPVLFKTLKDVTKSLEEETPKVGGTSWTQLP